MDVAFYSANTEFSVVQNRVFSVSHCNNKLEVAASCFVQADPSGRSRASGVAPSSRSVDSADLAVERYT